MKSSLFDLFFINFFFKVNVCDGNFPLLRYIQGSLLLWLIFCVRHFTKVNSSDHSVNKLGVKIIAFGPLFDSLLNARLIDEIAFYKSLKWHFHYKTLCLCTYYTNIVWSVWSKNKMFDVRVGRMSDHSRYTLSRTDAHDGWHWLKSQSK